jgi:universal stress protein E
MVALGATDASADPLLRKALTLARRFDASLQLVHIAQPYMDMADAELVRNMARPSYPDVIGADLGWNSDRPTYALVLDDLKQRAQELQKRIEKQARRSGVDVTATVVRDYPIADAIVRQVLEHKPDMLIAQSHRHGKLARALMSQTDWELIRNCPCPLWLSKSERLSKRAKVLAAIDPLHSRAKPTRLDDVILRAALAVAADKPAQVIACHAYTPPHSVMPAMTAELYWEPLSEKELERYRTDVRRTMERRLARYEIPARNRLLEPGEPASALVRTAKQHRVGVIVMGAISRSALKRFFIGNTAEIVIDDVDCDVLVVKPASFRTPVPRDLTPKPLRRLNAAVVSA